MQIKLKDETKGLLVWLALFAVSWGLLLLGAWCLVTFLRELINWLY